MARTSSRLASISAWLAVLSRLRRTSGSVLEQRTLNHQVGYSTLTPSSSKTLPSAYLALSVARISCGSRLTLVLISPEQAYLRRGAMRSESGLPARVTMLQRAMTAIEELSATKLSRK